MKSVIFQDEKLIDFIISFGIKPWDIVKGSPLNESAMDFLNNYILSKKTSEGMLSSLIDIFKETFWYGLAKKWNSEYYYLNLKENLKLNNKESPKKIKI